jgi:GNAT superfamily N-acetyltransferase
LVLCFAGGDWGWGIAQAFDAKEGKCVGTVVCKMGEHRGAFRGYIAMLVVLKPYRGRGIGDTFILFFFEDLRFRLLLAS